MPDRQQIRCGVYEYELLNEIYRWNGEDTFMKTRHVLIIAMLFFLSTFLLQGGVLSSDDPQNDEGMSSSTQQTEQVHEQQIGTAPAEEQGYKQEAEQQQNAGPAEEQEKADSEKEKCNELMEQAKQEREQSRFREAISTYEEAYKLCSDAGILFAIAEINDADLSQYRQALSYYERFIQAAASSENQNKEHAQVRIDQIQKGLQAYDNGVAFYKAQRYEEAIQEFQKTNDMCPHVLHSIHIALCYEKLAIKSYEESLNYMNLKPDAKAPLTDAELDIVKKRLQTMREHPPLFQ